LLEGFEYSTAKSKYSTAETLLSLAESKYSTAGTLSALD